MTKEQAIEILRHRTNLGYGIVIENENTNTIEQAFDMAIKALEIVEEFEKAQIITGGRLNGRTYAYKCGLEDGKRKALEQQPSEDCVSRKAFMDSYNGIETPIGYRKVVDMQVVEDLPPVKPTFPKGTTNGDMIKAMFPNVEVTEKNNGYEVYFGIGTATQYFNYQWWNAPYKKSEG